LYAKNKKINLNYNSIKKTSNQIKNKKEKING